MVHDILTKYLGKLCNLKRGNTPYGIAPHKPVLLISILELIEKGLVNNNRIYVNTDLVAAFQENWRLLVDTLNTPDLTLPLYHLQNDKVDGQQIWFLQPKPSCQIDAHIKSFNRLKEVVDFGCLSEEFYILLTNPESRAVIAMMLLDSYFPSTKSTFVQSKEKGVGYINDLESYILNEPEAKHKIIKIETEEEVFVRGGLFKRNVYKIYDSTCSFTGMRLETTFGHNFVDACHIVPFGVSHDDKVSNGIALCPNLHRAFDRGLVSLDDDYKIITSTHIHEDQNHAYSLEQLRGRKMRLPLESQYFPSIGNIEWHRLHVFKG